VAAETAQGAGEVTEPGRPIAEAAEQKGPEQAACQQQAEQTEPETKTQAQSSQPAEPSYKIALRFTKGDTARYRVITEAEKSVLWEGPAETKPKAFQGGHTGNRTELTFRQEVVDITDDGNAVLKITIEALKYRSRVKDRVVVDFNSADANDANSVMAKLLGLTYTVELSPSGQVVQVKDVPPTTISGTSSIAQVARKLVSPQLIKERHTIAAFPSAEKAAVQKGGSWSLFRTFHFGMMGSKTYEKIYELKEVVKRQGREITVVQMKAVPSVEGAEELQASQPAGFFSNLFDSTESYTGRLELDVTNGRLEQYEEKLKCDWLAVDPAASADQKTRPNALRMTALQVYEIERLD